MVIVLYTKISPAIGGMAETAVSRAPFAEILSQVDALRPKTAPT